MRIIQKKFGTDVLSVIGIRCFFYFYKNRFQVLFKIPGGTMDKSIVMIEKNNLLVSSSDLAIGFGLEHNRIKSLIKKYQNEFESWGGVLRELCAKPKGSKGGRALDHFLLNETQATYLTTLLSNNDKVRKFKHHLTNEFFKQKKLLNKILNQKQNLEWLEQRTSGKLIRREETDSIKEFAEYAKALGSKNHKRYYSNITQMQYRILFREKFKQFSGAGNFRDCLEHHELNILEISDKVVSQAILEGTKLEKPYKEVYTHIKTRTEGLALSLGISPIELMLKKKELPCQP